MRLDVARVDPRQLSIEVPTERIGVCPRIAQPRQALRILRSTVVDSGRSRQGTLSGRRPLDHERKETTLVRATDHQPSRAEPVTAETVPNGPMGTPQHLFGVDCGDRACSELLQSELGDEQFEDYLGHIGGVAKSSDEQWTLPRNWSRSSIRHSRRRSRSRSRIDLTPRAPTCGTSSAATGKPGRAGLAGLEPSDKKGVVLVDAARATTRTT